MKRLYVTGLIVIAACLTAYFLKNDGSKETIIFFPLDKKVIFETAYTTLTPIKKSKVRYDIEWKTSSETIKPAYLRQDVSLLYKDGRLEGIMRNWNTNTKKLSQSKETPVKESSLYEALTFHYGEIHTGEVITSSQQTSFTKKYLVLSKLSGFQFFETPITEEQQEWKLTLDNKKNSILESDWNEVIKNCSISRSRYTELPLTELTQKRSQFFSGIPESLQEQAIGRLWEGLYKNYVLGIKKEDGTILDPLNSTTPLLLLHKNKRELLVISQAKDHTPMLLRQTLTYNP